MRIEFLGRGRVVDPEGDELLRSGIPLALLAYLHSAAKPVGRDHLAMLFWPGRSRSRALQSLRQTLSRIRGALGEQILVSEGRSLFLNRTVFVVDVDELMKLCRVGEGRDALELWRGAYLQDFRHPESWELENWLEGERDRLASVMATALTEEIQVRVEAGHLSQAVRLGNRAADILPFRAELAESYFLALLIAGQKTEAAALLAEIRAADHAGLADRLAAHLAIELPTFGVTSGPPPAFPTHGDLPDGGRGDGEAGGRKRRDLTFASLLLLVPILALAGGVWGTGESNAFLAPAEDRLMVYCSEAATEGAGAQLFRMGLDGFHKHRLTSRIGCEAVWIEALGVLIFREELPDGPSAVVLTPDPTNPQAEWHARDLESTVRLLEMRFPGRHHSTVDDRQTVFVGREPGSTLSIYLLDPLKDALTRLTDDGGEDLHPAWDEQRREVVFSSDREGTRSLWVLPLDSGGAEPTRLTTSPSQDTRPVPHGDRLLYVRGFGEGATEGDMEIRLRSRETGQDHALVQRTWNDLDPVWSPDGIRICWQSEEFGHFESDIEVMDLGSRRSWSVTRGYPGRHADCGWTADGRFLFFRSTSELGVPIVALSDPDGQALHDLSRDAYPAYPRVEIPREAIQR